MSIIFILIISFLALLWAANHLVTGAKGLSQHYRISPLILGLTVVALGTSAPEIVLAIFAAFKEQNNITLGNAIGSNIANIGLVLGITMLIRPMGLNPNLLKKAYPVLIIAMLFVYSSILDGFLGQIDGCLFLLGCIGLISFFIHLAHQNPGTSLFTKELKPIIQSKRTLKLDVFSIILGLIILPISARYVLISATELARWLGVSDLTIGLTVVAIGTTLPELATAVTAAFKGEESLALGTILGSNIYNLLLILSFPALLNPAAVNNTVLWRDMPVLIFLCALLIFLNFYYKNKCSRCQGGILLLVYCSYIASLIIRAA